MQKCSAPVKVAGAYVCSRLKKECPMTSFIPRAAALLACSFIVVLVTGLW
jgi:hypothetical protein